MLKTDGNWYTPEPLFRDLEAKYGPFDMDVAAAPENAKCAEFYTAEQDGKAQPWRGRVWCNPPYSKLIEWVEKARLEVSEGRAERVVMLLPAQTSTRWFHDHALPFGKLEWIRGKVKFGGCKDRAIMPSLVVVFEPSASKEYSEGG